MTTLTASRRMPLRAAAICGLLALVTVTVAYIWGALAQPDAYRSADDASSDLGALTANKGVDLQPDWGQPHRDPDHPLRPWALARAQSRRPRADRRRRSDAHGSWDI